MPLTPHFISLTHALVLPFARFKEQLSSLAWYLPPVAGPCLSRWRYSSSQPLQGQRSVGVAELKGDHPALRRSLFRITPPPSTSHPLLQDFVIIYLGRARAL